MSTVQDGCERPEHKITHLSWENGMIIRITKKLGYINKWTSSLTASEHIEGPYICYINYIWLLDFN
jgi:hypothetical protein